MHAGYSRYFSPPPFELVGNKDINLFQNTTNAPLQPQTTSPFAERANYYDIGAQQKILDGLTVGVDTYYKQAVNLIDEGQFGAPIILTPFNYRHGQQYGAELAINYRPGPVLRLWQPGLEQGHRQGHRQLAVQLLDRMTSTTSPITTSTSTTSSS